jgi:hypothetical protein
MERLLAPDAKGHHIRVEGETVVVWDYGRTDAADLEGRLMLAADLTTLIPTHIVREYGEESRQIIENTPTAPARLSWENLSPALGWATWTLALSAITVFALFGAQPLIDDVAWVRTWTISMLWVMASSLVLAILFVTPWGRKGDRWRPESVVSEEFRARSS